MLKFLKVRKALKKFRPDIKKHVLAILKEAKPDEIDISSDGIIIKYEKEF